ncbi:hypothetical protein PUR23_16400 [Methylorubrum populi]|uniref:hypothetical protein n=1 Tax=Methylorubrum TaxID=2282523 RepID=UPI0031F93F3B
MKIREVQSDDGDYEVHIKSNRPILLNFDDLVQLASEENADAIPYALAHPRFPPPINHDFGNEGSQEDSVWLYERAWPVFMEVAEMLRCYHQRNADELSRRNWRRRQHESLSLSAVDASDAVSN